MAFLLLVVSILCIYNSFKIDIKLWYRSAFYSAQAPDGEYVWPLEKMNRLHITAHSSVSLFKCPPLNESFPRLENSVCRVSGGLPVLQRNGL